MKCRYSASFQVYDPSSVFSCKWKNCHSTYSTQEELYNHLNQDHIGRKASRNLCLACHWDGCTKTFTKRDHITSHLRVHVAFKPHGCRLCRKSFKRAQDLKKHETRVHFINELTTTHCATTQPSSPLTQHSDAMEMVDETHLYLTHSTESQNPPLPTC